MKRPLVSESLIILVPTLLRGNAEFVIPAISRTADETGILSSPLKISQLP